MQQRCEKHGKSFPFNDFCVDCLREQSGQAMLMPAENMTTEEWGTRPQGQPIGKTADMLKAQAAEIERLTKERDEARQNIDGILMHFEAAEARATAAEAKVAALEKAAKAAWEAWEQPEMNVTYDIYQAMRDLSAALGAKP